MPHSSGGGSHGGGSHGGSHGGSSGGSGGSSTKRSKTYFPGARTFVVYGRNGYRTIYSDRDITKKSNSVVSLIILAVIFSQFAVSGFVLFGQSIKKPKALPTDYSIHIVVNDNANVLTDKQKLYSTLNNFRVKTGITPSVMTVHNEEWKGRYSSLENYAYDLYVNNFDDESHWLIVYSEPSKASPGFVDWYWEGMQGDSTDEILNSEVLGVFNSNMQKNLTASTKFTPSQAIISAFESLDGVVMERRINYETLLFSLVWFAIVGLMAFAALRNVFIDYQAGKNGVEVLTELGTVPVLYEDTCEYCGGRYVVGTIMSCPHCGAALTPNDPHPAGTGKKKNSVE